MKRIYKKSLSHMNRKLYFAETAESGIQMERFNDADHENVTINKRKMHLCSSCHCLLISKLQSEYYKAIFFLFFYINIIGHIAQSCPTLCNLMDCSPWNSLGDNTQVDCHSLLQGVSPTQGIEPRSPAL